MAQWMSKQAESEEMQQTPIWQSARNGAIAGGLLGGMVAHRARRMFPVAGWKRALGGLWGGAAAGAGAGSFLNRWYQEPVLPTAEVETDRGRHWPESGKPLATLAYNHYQGAGVPLGTTQLFVPNAFPAPSRDYQDLQFREKKVGKPHESIRPEFTLEAIDPRSR